MKENKLKKVVTSTTRKKRAEEVDGQSYNFLSEESFLEKKQKGMFVEYAKVYGCWYGVEKAHLEDVLKRSHVLLVLDWQGALTIKKHYAGATLIFLLPPSVQALSQRLLGRGESQDFTDKRLSFLKTEVESAKAFDYFIINDDLNTAVIELLTVVRAENIKKQDKQKILRSIFEG